MHTPDSWASVNGQITPAAKARISVLDRGFLFADSVYEVLRTARKRPLFWPDHLIRLHRSADRIGLVLDDAPLLDELTAVAARMPGESRLRLIVTRGVEADGPGNRVIIATPLGTPASALFPNGCTLHCVPVPAPGNGPDPHAKTGDRKLAVQAVRAAQALGFYEAVRVAPDGRILEGATSTVFAVQNGILITPPLSAGVLAGITRAKVLEQAKALGIPIQLRTFLQSELAELDEVFITSSSRGVVPVRQIDAVHYAAPGTITHRLSLTYQALLES